MTRKRTKTAKTLVVTLGVIVVLFLTASSWLQVYYFMCVAQASGLPLPLLPLDLAIFDNGEYMMLVHLTLSPVDHETVLQAGRFHPAIHGDRLPPQRLSDFLYIEQLPARWQSVSASADLYHAGGCSPDRSWMALLDRTSGSLWIEVQ